MAAGAYKGLTIRIGADTTKLSAALRSADSAIYKTQQQLNKLTKAAKVEPGNNLVKTAQLGAISSQATAAARKIAELKQGVEDLGKTKVLGPDNKETGQTIKSLAENTTDATLKANEATAAYSEIDEELNDVYKSIKKVTGVDLAKATRAGNFEMGLRSAKDAAQRMGVDLSADFAKVDELKKKWNSARAEMDNYANVSKFQDMNNQIVDQEVHLRKLAAEYANVRKAYNMSSTSTIDRSLSGLNSEMSLVSAATETAAQKFRTLDQAAKIDPKNMDLAADRAKALAETIDLTEREMGLLQDKIASYESRDGFKEKAASIKDVGLNLEQAKQRYEEAEQKVAALNIKLQETRGAGNVAADGLNEVGQSGEGMDRAAESADNLEQQIKEAEEEARQALEAFDFAKAVSELDNAKTSAAEMASTLATLRASFGGLKVESNIATSLKPVNDELKTVSVGVDTARSRFETLSKAAEIRPYSIKAAVEQVRALREATNAAQEKASLLKQKLESYKASGIDKLAQYTNNSAVAFEKAQKRVNDLQRELALVVSKEGETSAKAQELRAALEAAFSSAKTAAAINEFKQVETELRRIETESKSMKNAMKADFGEVGAAAVQAATAIGNLIERAGRAVITSSDEIDKSYRDLRKTFDAEERDYQKLYDAAMKYSQSHVTSADSMLEMESIAAQLGVGIEGGADAIQKFAEVAANLDVATDIDADTIALQMGQISNVMSDLSTDNIDKFGDALVRLGNNMPTQESNIMQITQRLSAIGDVANFTTPQLMGWAAAIASTGQRSEAAATGVATTITTIAKAVDGGGDELEKFAKVAGKSAEQFANDWKTKPSQTLQEFMTKLGESDELFSDLMNLDINGVRQTQTLAALSQTVGQVNDAITMATDAFEGVPDKWGDVGDAAREAEQKASGFSGSLAKMKNSAQVLAATLGPALIPAIDWVSDKIQGLTKFINGFSTGTKETLVSVAAGFAVFSTAMPVVGALASALKNFGGTTLAFVIKQIARFKDAFATFSLGGGIVDITTKAGAFAKIGTAMSKVATAVFSVQGALAALAIVLGGKVIAELINAKIHSDRLNKTLGGIKDTTKGLGLDLFAGEIQDFSGEWANLREELDHFHENMDKHAKSIKDTREETAKSIGELDKYKQVIMNAVGRGDEYSGSIAELKWAVDGLNGVLGTTYDYKDVLKGVYEDESGAVHDLTSEIYNLIEAKKAEMRLNAMEEIYGEAYKTQVEAQNAYEKAKEARRNFVKEFKQDHAGDLTRDTYTGQLRPMTDQELTFLARGTEGYRELDAAVQDTKLSLRDANEQLKVADGQLSGMTEGYWAKEGFFGDRAGIILTTDSIREAISAYTDWGDSFDEVLPKAKELAEGLQNAKVGVSDFTEMVSQNPGLFEGMIEKSQGDMDKLVDMVSKWNHQHLDDKYAEFHWDGEELVNADGDRIAWNDQLSDWAPVELEAESHVEEGVAEAEAEIEGSEADINVGADTEQAEAEIDAIEGEGVEVPVDADTEQAQEEIDAIEGEGVEVPVSADADQAAGEIQAAVPQDTEVHINVVADVSAAQQVTDAVANLPADPQVMITVSTTGVLNAIDRIGHLNEVASSMNGANASYDANGNAATSTEPADNVSSLNDAASNMASKEITLSAVGNAADGSAAGNVRALVSAINGMHDKSVTLTTTNVTHDVKKAAGTYINPNKIPKHAAGIFTRPTLTNIGWVGEDGAELFSGNSLVPLTNRKYSMPYIDDISDAVAKKLGGLGTVNNYYVNDAIVNGDAEIQAAFLTLFDTLARKGAMNVG